MTEIRSLRLTPPEGQWEAVALRESATAVGPWKTVQARKVDAPGPVTIAFRPKVADGYYRPIWVPAGGSRAGALEGAVVRLGEGSGAASTYGGS